MRLRILIMAVRKGLRSIFLIAMIVGIVPVCALLPFAMSYFPGDFVFEILGKSQPQTRQAAERYLWLAYARTISKEKTRMIWDAPKDAICVQYWVLGMSPIEVIYSQDGRVVRIEPAYE